MPDDEGERREQRFEFLTKVYEREKKLGGIDLQKVSTAVTNVIFRGTYIQPNRFYPHTDSMMAFLDTPLAEVLPKDGPGADAFKEYRILHDFVRGNK
jgi:hypothetical protein